MRYIIIIMLFAACQHGEQKPSNKISSNILFVDSFHLDSLPGGSTASFSTDGTVTVQPCGIDTIKGVLIYHNETDYSNNGNGYDNGYWVGKCGPLGMPIEDMLFIPGQMKLTTAFKPSGAKETDPWQIEQELYSNDRNGKFYDYAWKEVKAKNVYCLYRLNKH